MLVPALLSLGLSLSSELFSNSSALAGQVDPGQAMNVINNLIAPYITHVMNWVTKVSFSLTSAFAFYTLAIRLMKI